LMVPVLEESEERRRFLSFLDFFLVLELNIISIAIYGWQSIL
jgi:hypothetical protein